MLKDPLLEKLLHNKTLENILSENARKVKQTARSVRKYSPKSFQQSAWV